jgi:hypothetical protein
MMTLARCCVSPTIAVGLIGLAFQMLIEACSCRRASCPTRGNQFWHSRGLHGRQSWELGGEREQKLSSNILSQKFEELRLAAAGRTALLRPDETPPDSNSPRPPARSVSRRLGAPRKTHANVVASKLYWPCEEDHRQATCLRCIRPMKSAGSAVGKRGRQPWCIPLTAYGGARNFGTG